MFYIFYLEGRETEADRDLPSTVQLPNASNCEDGANPKQGIWNSILVSQMVRTQELEPWPAAFQGMHKQEAGLEVSPELRPCISMSDTRVPYYILATQQSLL